MALSRNGASFLAAAFEPGELYATQLSQTIIQDEQVFANLHQMH